MESVKRVVPSLREGPWRDPEGKVWYAKRDAAFVEWAASGLCVATAGERAFAKAVFCAGWEARKRAVDYQIVNPASKDASR